MAKLEKVEFWVYLDPATGNWSYRSAKIPWHTGTDAYVLGLHCRTPEAAKNAARYEIRQYGYGSTLVPVPHDFALAQGLLKGEGNEPERTA